MKELSRIIREYVADGRTDEMVISPDDGIVASDFLDENDTVKLLTAEQSRQYEMQSRRIHMAIHLSRTRISKDDFGTLSIRSALAFHLTSILEKFARQRYLPQMHILSKAMLCIEASPIDPDLIRIEATVLIKELTI